MALQIQLHRFRLTASIVERLRHDVLLLALALFEELLHGIHVFDILLNIVVI